MMRPVRLFLPLCALGCLANCSDMPQRWTESEIREIAADEAADAMPAGTADAALVEDAINELREENTRLRGEIEAQQRQIDSLQAQLNLL